MACLGRMPAGGDSPPREYICDLLELQGGVIESPRAFSGEPFEAPEWLARWVEWM
jgi:hypothetical protein